MTLKIFFDAMSQPSRSVLLLAKCTGIPFTPVVIDILKGKTRTNEFKLISPTGRVPAIQDGDFTLFESAAILRYLCQSQNLDDHWYPKDQQKRSKVDEYLAWHHTGLRTGAAGTVFKSTLQPLMTGQPPRDVEENLKILQKSIDMFDKYFLLKTPFISSEQITIADLIALTEFSQLEVMGSKMPPFSDIVNEWRQRCIEVTEPHYTEVHKIHSKVKKTLVSRL